MIRTILAFFGFVKVPVEAVQLAMVIDDYFKKTKIPLNPKYREMSGVLLEFLRTGRLLG